MAQKGIWIRHLPDAIVVGKEDETQKYNSKEKMEIGMTTIRDEMRI